MFERESEERAVVKLASGFAGISIGFHVMFLFSDWIVTYAVYFVMVVASMTMGLIVGRKIYEKTRNDFAAWSLGIMTGALTGGVILLLGSLLPGVEDKIETILSQD